jgi:hypothetical protein
VAVKSANDDEIDCMTELLRCDADMGESHGPVSPDLTALRMGCSSALGDDVSIRRRPETAAGGGDCGALSIRCRKAVVDVSKMDGATRALLTRRSLCLSAAPSLCSAAVGEAAPEVAADLRRSCRRRRRRRGGGEACS